MGPEYGIDAAGKFFLVSVPTLVGAVLRLPYTFAVAKFGGRNWTIVSAALLIIATTGAGHCRTSSAAPRCRPRRSRSSARCSAR